MYKRQLKDRAARLDTSRHAELLERIDAALEMDKDIVGSVFDWTKDRERLEIKRRQLAGLIKEVHAALGK